eukprot:scaffold9097_cov108-Isochrysis_galbana.AAC.1
MLPRVAPKRDAMATLDSWAGRSASPYAAPTTCTAAPHVIVYANELSSHILPKTSTEEVTTAPSVAAIHMAKTPTSTVQPPSRSVKAAPSSLPPRQTMDTHDRSAPTDVWKAGPNSGSASTDVLMEGIITRPDWFTKTARKSSQDVDSGPMVVRKGPTPADASMTPSIGG